MTPLKTAVAVVDTRSRSNIGMRIGQPMQTAVAQDCESNLYPPTDLSMVAAHRSFVASPFPIYFRDFEIRTGPNTPVT
jgi:hypothetical protein